MLAVTAATLALTLATTAVAQVIGSDSATRLAATFETCAATDATVKACRTLPAINKIEGRYTGTMTIGERRQERALDFSLKILYDRATGVGDADGTWQLATSPDPRSSGPQTAS